MPTPEQVRETIERYVAAYSSNDRAAVLECFAPDAVWHDPVGAPPHRGREAIGAFWDESHALAERIVLEPRTILVCGAEGAMVFDIRTEIGGERYTMEAVEVFVVADDGRISEARAYWEPARMRPAG